MKPEATFQHTRSSGKKHTYTVQVYGNKYVILLGDKELKRASRVATFGNVSPLEADRVFAISDIEQLLDMEEE